MDVKTKCEMEVSLEELTAFREEYAKKIFPNSYNTRACMALFQVLCDMIKKLESDSKEDK